LIAYLDLRAVVAAALPADGPTSSVYWFIEGEELLQIGLTVATCR